MRKGSLRFDLRLIFKVLRLLLSKGDENGLFTALLHFRSLSPLVIIQQFFVKSVYLLIQPSLGLLQATQHIGISFAWLMMWLRPHEERVAFFLKLHGSDVFGPET